ncbi:MAG: cysteine--tRNA ligase [Patescibacteria group bacterium]|nr:cysteine--tRNA ligase [Patescibacteria group bacterium]MDD5164042.1 cysteine--tRNA ligase [Patescibacteria group bacterium]MDD5534874.1 cysteine--tRNA ligase [Patescibacteria group bacterium]
MLKLYNTLTRQKEEFKPIKPGFAGIYSCGPTVYWYQHIGCLRAYIFADVLKKTLIYNNYQIKHVINVTDVGHLTSDADTGEDKMEKAAAKEGKKAEDIANYYWQILKDDFKKLNISEPDIWCKATEHIKEQIELIKKLEEKGYTYKTSDGIYFDTSKLKDYGKLAGLKIEGLEAGARIEMKEKKNITDFALWKFSPSTIRQAHGSGQAKRQQEWESPWGIGFPGWHIECSAMSMKYLGEHFDIHTGGEEHIAIHHTNEIAQSEAATGKKFVNYWLHIRWLLFKGGKMSKSKGEIYTLSELKNLNFQSLAFRYLCLNTHYRSPLSFDLESLTAAQNALNNLYQIVGNFPKPTTIIKEVEEKFDQAINDDLNTPKALAVVWDLLKEKYPDEQKMATLLKFDQVLGLNLDKVKPIEIPEEISALAKEREELRKQKKWSEADQVRKKIEDLGFTVEDAEQGSIIKKLS